MKTEIGLSGHADIGGITRYATIVAALFAMFCGGCASFNHTSSTCCTDQVFSGWRDHVWAKRAYHQRFLTCADRHPSHFRSGFLAGYSAVCRGEDGYVPAVPPKSYWGYSYQTAEGNEMVGSWFAGYPEGVRAATEDGAGLYRDVQVSAMLNAAMQPQDNAWAQYSAAEPMGGGDQPPVLSGQDLEMPPPAPAESLSPTSRNVPPQMTPADTTLNYRRLSPERNGNQPLADKRQQISWNQQR